MRGELFGDGRVDGSLLGLLVELGLHVGDLLLLRQRPAAASACLAACLFCE